jgi:hypothetical protein
LNHPSRRGDYRSIQIDLASDDGTTFLERFGRAFFANVSFAA